MKMPLVSICIPAYNHERFVQDCIRSVMDQDYDNIELLVIDDGSSDRTWPRILELRPECERRFARVVMETRANRGRAETLRELYRLASGDLVGEIASDDLYLPGAIAALAAPFSADRTLGLVVGVNVLVDADGRRCFWDCRRQIVYSYTTAAYATFDAWLEKRHGISMDGEEFGDYRRLLRANHVPNGSLKRRSMCDLGSLYDAGAPLEDWWFHLQFSKVAKYRHIPQETFCYRWHGENTAVREAYMLDAARKTLRREAEKVEESSGEWKLAYESAVPWFRRQVLFHCPIGLLWLLWRSWRFLAGKDRP